MNDHITFYFKFESINLFGLETLFVLHCVCVSCYGFFNGYSPVYHTSPEARFSKVPITFRASKSNIQIEILRIRARVLASKLLHFVSLTDNFIMLDAKLLKLLSYM